MLHVVMLHVVMLHVVMLRVVVLHVVMLHVVMLNVIMLKVIMLNVRMLKAVMLNVVMLNAFVFKCKGPALHAKIEQGRSNLPGTNTLAYFTHKGYWKKFYNIGPRFKKLSSENGHQEHLEKIWGKARKNFTHFYFKRESLLKGRLSTVDLLILTNLASFYTLNIIYFFMKQTEVNRTEHFPFGECSLQVSISPIFYEQLFNTKVFCAAVMCLQIGFVIFWWMDFGAKDAHEILVKLTPELLFLRPVKILWVLLAEMLMAASVAALALAVLAVQQQARLFLCEVSGVEVYLIQD
jgi:hypothetical protein